MQPEADFNAVIDHENSVSSALGGRSVFDGAKPTEKRRQRSLF